MSELLTHGGDWAGFLSERGKLPLDFSASISPLGVPGGVRAAVRQAAGQMDRDPDPLCRALRESISEYELVPPQQILCGNGAAELIFRVVWALRPRQALVTAPTFSEYGAALQSVGCAVKTWSLPEKRDFRLEEGVLDAITPETDLVFLCEPNNPTGVTAGRPLLLQILRRCRETGTRLVLDECFGDLLDDPESHTLKGELEAYPNLLILKAFTKLYAMAGIRLGYALCADRALLERMYLAGQPWSVSVPAQAAGAAALRETAYRERVRSLVRRERPCLAKRLGTLGLRVVPGEANYLLFQSPVSLGEPLARRGILLRSCDNYIGLDETWYRTAVRTRRQNQRLVEALEEIVK